MSPLLRRVALFCARHRAPVIGAWLVLLVGVGLAGHVAGTKFSSGASAPGSDSAAANDLMARSFSSHLSDSSPLVFHTDTGKLSDPARSEAVEAALHAVSASPDIAMVGQPVVSADGRTEYVSLVPAKALGDLTADEAQAILDAAQAPTEHSGVTVAAGGQLGGKISKPATESSELVGILVAILILVLVFGTVTAMALPIAVAIGGVACGLSLITLLGHVLEVPDVAPTVATMIGLGVGIDYSLFIVTRARAARYRGMATHEAIGHAAATSGSAVAFAGATVVVALLSLAVSGLSIVTVLGQAAALVVVVAVLASMTLLPALLSLCGDRIERLRIGPDRRPTLGHSVLFERLARGLARRPGTIAVTCIVALVVLCAPARNLQLGLTDQSSAPKGTTSREAYDLLTDAFGPGANGALLVSVDHPSGSDDPRVTALAHDIAAADGAQSVSAPQMSPDGSAALISVVPEGAPSSDATRDLVHEVRDDIVPGSGLDAHVGGSTAQLLDLADQIGRRLPLIIGVVVALSVLLLLVAFRSVVAPLQAAFVNLLAVGAAYGITTAVFQMGHGASLMGLDGAIPIVSYVPMIMFAILFGLSMDYQVFLLSRVREEIDAGKSAREAVVAGLAATGKVIASAAAIMVAVFASFIINGDPTVKEFGVGLASAILIAGSMVCLLLPAVMLVMGERTWWVPRWLDRRLPHLSLEGEPEPA